MLLYDRLIPNNTPGMGGLLPSRQDSRRTLEHRSWPLYFFWPHVNFSDNELRLCNMDKVLKVKDGWKALMEVVARL
jgi:hypothetical protein